MTCPTQSERRNCRLKQCTLQQREKNELECNTPICDNKDLCIPVYYTPSDLKQPVSFHHLIESIVINILIRF